MLSDSAPVASRLPFAACTLTVTEVMNNPGTESNVSLARSLSAFQHCPFLLFFFFFKRDVLSLLGEVPEQCYARLTEEEIQHLWYFSK